jgi:hypothetical protein
MRCQTAFCFLPIMMSLLGRLIVFAADAGLHRGLWRWSPLSRRAYRRCRRCIACKEPRSRADHSPDGATRRHHRHPDLFKEGAHP